jgi:hypothetical protein
LFALLLSTTNKLKNNDSGDWGNQEDNDNRMLAEVPVYIWFIWFNSFLDDVMCGVFDKTGESDGCPHRSNENKMSRRERGRASQRDKETKSSQTRYNIGSRSAPSIG